ncbi:MAG: hypothetical protein ACTS2F_15820 [Thainema sp.]
MTQQLLDLIQQAEALSIEDQLTLIAHLAQNIKTTTDQTKSLREGKSLWQIADDFVADVPAETLSQLPRDGAVEHDHYIYGTDRVQA